MSATCVKMAMGTRKLDEFYFIRVRVWVNFYTYGFVNGLRVKPSGFLGVCLQAWYLNL